MPRSTSQLAAVLVLVAGVTLGACSTVHDIAGLPRAGPQSDGSYILTSSESSMDCRSLAERVEVALDGMSKAAAKIPKEKEALPPTMLGVFERALGGVDQGMTSARKLREGELHVRALAAEQARKGCATSADLEARIAATRPQPI